MKTSTLDLKSVCTGCQKEVSGRLYFDERMKVVDSDGGLALNEGWRCHNCLGEPWASSDSVVKP